jgi:homoserine O-acetyltransferase/O-succinyltransferase
VDPAKYFVIVVDALGNGVSSSPSNSKTQHGPDFPHFTEQDMVAAEYRLATETMHLKHVHAVMGISMGGQQTFEWVADYPDFMDLAIPIVGSPRPSTFDELIYRTGAEAIRRDPDWHGGRYTGHPPMPLAAALMQIQLTSPANYIKQHPAEKFESEYTHTRENGILPFDANDWLWQIEAIIRLDIAHGGSLEDAAKRIKAKLLVVNAAQDHLVNPKPALDFAATAGAKTYVLQSDCGHMATSCESDALGEQTRAFLDGN